MRKASPGVPWARPDDTSGAILKIQTDRPVAVFSWAEARRE